MMIYDVEDGSKASKLLLALVGEEELFVECREKLRKIGVHITKKNRELFKQLWMSTLLGYQHIKLTWGNEYINKCSISV